MKQRIFIILFMMILAAVFGGAVTGIYLVSQDTLQRNREIRLQKAYLDVFGIDVESRSNAEVEELVERRIVTETDSQASVITDPETGSEYTVIKGYADDDRNELIGVAFRFRGMGFWAPIEGLLGLTPDLNRTLGLVILEQKETPGLGGRIEETDFLKPFEQGVKVAPPADDGGGKFLVISSTAPGAESPVAARHVMAITGATQTSVAMERILNENLKRVHRGWDSR